MFNALSGGSEAAFEDESAAELDPPSLDTPDPTVVALAEDALSTAQMTGNDAAVLLAEEELERTREPGVGQTISEMILDSDRVAAVEVSSE